MNSHIRSLFALTTIFFFHTDNYALTRADMFAPKPITGPITITSSGSYTLAYNIKGMITISASNVTLNLNNYTISGGTHGILVNNTAAHVEIENGGIGPIIGGNGIEISAGCSDITVRRVHVHNSDIGIHAASAGAIILRDTVCLSCTNEGVKFETCTKCASLLCAFSSCDTGMLLYQTTDSHIEDTAAVGNVTSGFILDGSSKIGLFKCKSILNGATSTTTSYGIACHNGSKNIIYQCLVDGTTTTSTTEGDIAASIALTGTENNSSVLSCTISNTNTNVAGNSTAHGILINPTLSTLTSLAADDRGAQVNNTSWHPGSNYVVLVGATATNGEVSLYSFPDTEDKLSLLQNYSIGAAVYASGWSYDGTMLAVAGDAGPDTSDLFILEFENNALEELDTEKHGATIRSLNWSADNSYIATAGDTASSNEIHLYQVNKGDKTIILRDSKSHGANLHAIAWSPDCRYVIAGGEVFGGFEIRLYEFTANAKTFTLRDSQAHGATVRSVALSSDGKFVCIGGDAGTGGFDTRIYELDTGAKTLTLRDSATHGATVRAVSWSPNDYHVVTAGDTITANEGRVYSFSDATKTITLQQSINHGATLYAADWSRNGRGIAIGGTLSGGATHKIYSGVDSPTKCIVSQNTIFNVHGNARITSTGISAPDVVNLIVGNTLYGNDINKRFTMSM